MMETEGEQIGLEWGQLLMQRVLKRFGETTGEKFEKLSQKCIFRPMAALQSGFKCSRTNVYAPLKNHIDPPPADP